MAAGAHVLGSCRKQGEQEGSTGRQGDKRGAPFVGVVEVGPNAGRVKPYGPQEEHQSKEKTGGLGKAFHGRVRGQGKHTEHCEIEK